MYQSITGKVVAGKGYGRTIGFPTVNLEKGIDAPEIDPGIYSGTAILEGKEYRAGIVVDPNQKVEAHLIGYSGDAYGKIVTLNVRRFLREFRHFGDEKELIIQIKKDLALC
jgi:FAD synthase